MRLLFFIDSLGSGGAQRQMLAIANKMIGQGHNVYIAWYANDDFYRAEFESIGAHCIKCDKIKQGRLSFFVSIVRRIRPDTVLAFLFAQTVISAAGKLITFGKWRLIISMRSNNPKIFMAIKRRVVRPLYMLASRIVCNSYAESEVWSQHCNYLKKRVTVIPNYVMVNMQHLEIENEVGDNAIRILVPANLSSYIKNPLNVAKALNLLSSEEREHIVIDWYGRRHIGNELSTICMEVESYIVEHHLDTCFVTHDETHDIHTIMARCDIVALFSTEEGLPNAICEGMMLSKPVIMTKVSDWEKLIVNNGLVCEGTDPDSIAAALRTAISWSKEDLTIMGRVSKELANSLFSDETITDKWLTALIHW